jgi:glycosyltransferase involved in cell wall biosynthesis
MQNQSLKFSIVTAVYNRRETIGDSIRSLQRQKYSNFEHVIVDGSSTDGTLDVIKTLADHRTKIQSQADEGIYDALNKGVLRSQGDIIGLLHSDDIFASPNTLIWVARAFERPGVLGVYGDLQYVSASEPSRVIRHWRAGEYSRSRLHLGWMPPHPTLFLRKEVFEKWGGYDSSYKISADYDAMLRWLNLGQIELAYEPNVLVKMRVGGASNQSIRQILTKSCEDYRALRTNNVGGLFTLALKNFGKVGQFLFK